MMVRLLRLAYLTVTHAFAAVRSLPIVNGHWDLLLGGLVKSGLADSRNPG